MIRNCEPGEDGVCLVCGAKVRAGTKRNCSKPGAARPVHAPEGGVGGHLKSILATIGIHAQPNCSCNKRAAYLDSMGPRWAEDNIETVVGWLQEEARKRRLPFFKTVGRMLVRRAIMFARRR